MKPFSGYAAGKSRLVLVPDQFFSELLPEIDSLDELRLCLYFFWRIDRMEGTFRYLRRQDILDDVRRLELFSRKAGEIDGRVEEALTQAVAHGALLHASVQQGEAQVDLYFLNSPHERAALEAIRSGEWRHTQAYPPPLDMSLVKPNIFQLYEENIGPLTPMIAEALRDAEESYPPAWIDEAIRLSVERNKRSWRYVAAILKRWQEEGRDERKDRRDTEAGRRRYREWESPGK